jgi:hypothetical protein
MSLGDFVRFVFRQFYPAMWSAHEFLRRWPLGGSRGRTIAQRRRVSSMSLVDDSRLRRAETLTSA